MGSMGFIGMYRVLGCLGLRHITDKKATAAMYSTAPVYFFCALEKEYRQGIVMYYPRRICIRKERAHTSHLDPSSTLEHGSLHPNIGYRDVVLPNLRSDRPCTFMPPCPPSSTVTDVNLPKPAMFRALLIKPHTPNPKPVSHPKP